MHNRSKVYPGRFVILFVLRAVGQISIEASLKRGRLAQIEYAGSGGNPLLSYGRRNVEQDGGDFTQNKGRKIKIQGFTKQGFTRKGCWMKRWIAVNITLGAAALLVLAPAIAPAAASKRAEAEFDRVFMGKDVKSLIDMPAYKDGIDLYVSPKSEKRFDARGIDLKELGKYLKEKGVGVEQNEWVIITDVKIDSDRIEVQLGGGGEGRGESKKAERAGGYKRAGGSRINFRYGRIIGDADLEPDAFLPLMNRVLDTSKITGAVIPKDIAPQYQDAIRSKDVTVGMSYQMVLLSMGDPDQKKVDDSTDESLRETWFYLKDGHRWVVKFTNGKVAKVQVY